MLKVHLPLKQRGDCDNSESHVDRTVAVVENTVTGQTMKFCQKCLWAHLVLMSKGMKPEPAAPENGQPRLPTLSS